MKEVWTQAMCKELGRLAQGFGDKKGTNTIFYMTKEEIKQIPRDRTVTCVNTGRLLITKRGPQLCPNHSRR